MPLVSGTMSLTHGCNSIEFTAGWSSSTVVHLTLTAHGYVLSHHRHQRRYSDLLHADDLCRRSTASLRQSGRQSRCLFEIWCLRSLALLQPSISLPSPGRAFAGSQP